MTAATYAAEGFKARTAELARQDQALARIYSVLAAYAARTGDDTPVYLALIAADHEIPDVDLIERVEQNYYDELAAAVRDDVKMLRAAADREQTRRAWGGDVSTGEGPAEPHPIPQTTMRDVRDGDTIRLGGREIEIHVHAIEFGTVAYVRSSPGGRFHDYAIDTAVTILDRAPQLDPLTETEFRDSQASHEPTGGRA
jgi:hypothetical protein